MLKKRIAGRRIGFDEGSRAEHPRPEMAVISRNVVITSCLYENVFATGKVGNPHLAAPALLPVHA
jgi:hypothetical protein